MSGAINLDQQLQCQMDTIEKGAGFCWNIYNCIFDPLIDPYVWHLNGRDGIDRDKKCSNMSLSLITPEPEQMM